MHLLRLLNHFDRADFKTTLAVARGGGSYEARLHPDVAVEECGWRSLPSATLRMQTAIPHLRRVLEREQPGVVLAFLDHAVAATAKALTGLSRRPLFVAGIQNNLEQTLKHLPRWTRTRLSREILAGYAQADHVIALSAGVGETLLELVPAARGRVSVVYNAGYDDQVEELAKQEPTLPLPAGPLFLGCGRLTQQKDFSTLLRAFARFAKADAGELWLLGEGELRPALEREISALGLAHRVRLPGFVKNPFAFMSHATSFVLSSRWEGFGNVLTEAMACGTPVISTDCPHGPREILEDGKWGSLVPVGDVPALAEAMRASVNERSHFRARAEGARAHVTRFEAGAITQQYADILLQTARRRDQT